jgi:hypothetical protein
VRSGRAPGYARIRERDGTPTPVRPSDLRPTREGKPLPGELAFDPLRESGFPAASRAGSMVGPRPGLDPDARERERGVVRPADKKVLGRAPGKLPRQPVGARHTTEPAATGSLHRGLHLRRPVKRASWRTCSSTRPRRAGGDQGFPKN